MDAMGASAASLQQYDNSNNTLKGNAIAEGNAKKPAAVGVVMALASAREVNIEMPIHALRCLAHRDGGALPSPFACRLTNRASILFAGATINFSE